MGYKYHTGDRTFGGSMSRRLNPSCVDDRLNARLGPSLPRPLVRATSGGRALGDPYPARKNVTGLKNKNEGGY